MKKLLIAMALCALPLVFALTPASAAQCRIGAQLYDCTDPQLKGQHINYIPGCTGPQTKGKKVKFGNNVFTCSGGQHDYRK